MKKIKMFSIKSLSVFMAVLIALLSLPLTAFAISIEQTPPSTEGAASETIKEVFELTDRRTADTKYFRLEDGTIYVAQYDSAVHYLDENGEWKDIDNTLSASGDTYATNDQKIKFAKKTNGNGEIFTLHDGNRKLTLTLQEANKKVNVVVTNNETEFSDSTSKITKMTTLDKISTSILYADILKNTDLEYVVNSENIKENIIVKTKADSYSYVFSMSLNNLSAAMSAEGGIDITDPSTGELAYRIPAPFMYDASGAYSQNVTLTLEENGNGKYTLTVTADAAWINAEDRAFPVTIDPPLVSGHTNSEIDCTYIDSADPESSYGAYTAAVLSPTIKVYWKTASLPVIPASAYITDASFKVTMNLSAAWYGCLGVYDVYSDWDEDYLNQSAIDDGGVGLTDSNFTDFVYFQGGSAAPTDLDYTFNITPIAKSWYNQDNFGLMIKLVEGEDFNGSVLMYMDDYYTSSARPVLTVSYRDMKGLESYWSAAGHSAGFAGSGAVNYANGNLVLSIPTLTTSDALMPISPALVYCSVPTVSQTTTSTGPFKLNLSETVKAQSYINEDNATITYYMWNDSDGTDHAFMPVPGENDVFKDEDGLLLTLKKLLRPKEDDPSKTEIYYTMSDDSGTVKTFKSYGNSYGMLESITDSIGNKVELESNDTGISVKLYPKGSTTGIEQLRIAPSLQYPKLVWNPNSGEAVIFRYAQISSDTLMDIFDCMPQVIRAHSSNNTATESEWLTYASGTSIANTSKITVDAIASYGYDEIGRLNSVTNGLSNYTVTYEYYNNGKIKTVTESAGGETGQTLGFSYGTSHTVVRTSGTDDAYNTSDDLLTTYVFDSQGRTISGYTTDTTGTVLHGASAAQYVGEENENAKNNIKTAVSTTNQSANYMPNGGFEFGLEGWTTVGTVSASSAEPHSGVKSAKMQISNTVNSSSLSQGVALERGKYTVSMFLWTSGLSDSEIYIRVKNEYSGITYSERVSITSDAPNGMFTFASFDFYTNIYDGGTTAAYTITIEMLGTPDAVQTVYVDDVMLSKDVGVSDFDAIDHGHFENVGAGYTSRDCWIKNVDGVNSSITLASVGDPFGTALKMDGGIYNNAHAYQTLYSADEDQRENYLRGWYSPNYDDIILTVGGWAKSAAPSYSENSEFSILVEVIYCIGAEEYNTDKHYVNFDRSISGWQYANASFAISCNKGMVDSVTVYVLYNNNGSHAYFDDITLISGESSTETYSYNDHGYITHSKFDEYNQWHTYDDNKNIIKTVASDKTVIEYTYNAYNQVLTENHQISDYGPNLITGELSPSASLTVEYFVKYEYNIYGQCISTEIKDSPQSATYISKILSQYSTSPHTFGLKVSDTDTLGNNTSYFYDEYSGRLLAVIYPKGNGVCYTYDSVGNIAQINSAVTAASGYQQVTGTNNKSVSYNYDVANRLSSITTSTTTYNFTYDVFGNSANVSAGSNVLASYTYNDYNGKLSELTYGNGLKVKYVYDELDRTSEILYNTGSGGTFETVCKYEYDSGGRLYSVTDCKTDEVTLYKYDPSGKLLRTVLYDSTTYENLYIDRYEYDVNSYLASKWEITLYRVGTDKVRELTRYSYYREMDGELYGMTVWSGDNLTIDLDYTYDKFGKLLTKTAQFENSGEEVFYTKVTYRYKAGTYGDSSLIEQYKLEQGVSAASASTKVYNYTYDAAGNTTQISNEYGVIQHRYEYDELGQLTREDNRPLGKSFKLIYDNSGNILRKETYSFTTGTTLGSIQETLTYTYSNGSWGDQLTNVGGWTYTYDAIGNPISKTNTNGESVEFTWSGRDLTSWYSYYDGELVKPMSFTYNADGVRTSKSYYDEVTEYVLDGSRIVSETSSSYTLVYVYDESGSPIGVKYRSATYAEGVYDCYFYEKNVQGDVVAIYNSSGAKIATYTYDAWGNFIKSKTSGITYSTSDNYVYNNNPFTYRSYYYDSQTGLYYLQSRYYDPVIGRFINADGYVNATGDLTGYNMYAYCGNNPVVRTDVGGGFWDTVFDIVSIAFSVVDVITNPTDPLAWAGLAGDVIDLVPFVTGVGETVKIVGGTLKVAETIDDVRDSVKAVEIISETIDTVNDTSKSLKSIEETRQAATNLTEVLTEVAKQRENQKALRQLGDEINRNAKNGKFISFDEAKIFDEWCKEYNIPQHHSAEIGSGEHWITGWDHTHFGGTHIPFKK